MAKYSTKTSLSREQALELIGEFFECIGSIHGPSEIAKIFQDLVSRQELVMIAKRLKIAQLLLAGDTYAEVQRKTRASMPTIARINSWLRESGEGFRLIWSRRKQTALRSAVGGSPWRSLRRRYPMYFWPQLLIEDAMKHVSSEKRKQIQKVLNTLKQKSRLNKELQY